MATSDCPHCGYSNPIDSGFCRHCGTALARQQPPEEPDDESPPSSSVSAEDQVEKSPGPEEEKQGESPPSRTQGPISAHAEPQDEGEGRAQKTEWAQEAGEQEPEADDEPQPLLGGLEGLLDLADTQSFSTAGAGNPDPASNPPTLSRDLTLDEEERRQLRQLFAEELPLEAGAQPEPPPEDQAQTRERNRLQRRPWLEAVLFMGLVGALLWGAEPHRQGPGQHALPGLDQAHQQLDSLPPNSLVLVNWAYDPATAGEMDFVAQPVVEHLLRKEAKLIVVSQLPGGPASARRVIARAEDTLRRPSRAQFTANQAIEGGFLPGGAASLPLLGAAPAQALPVDPRWVGLRDRFDIALLADSGPALSLVVAAGAEDVRRWLEQVQPYNGAPVVAVTSAVVDPSIRPYLDSGQLAGLVSGWDGGRAYIRRSERTRSVEEQARSSRLVSGLNWGIGILIAAILLGNLVGLTERRMP